MLWEFFLLSISMENILQSLVKIIIIGSLYKQTFIECNRQFLPPPLPYYPNGNFFIPNFAPPYHEPLPVYYREESPPPPISFQNMNSFTPPQLFHQNENYNPLPFSPPAMGYSSPQVFQQKPDFHQPYKTQPSNGLSNLNSGVSLLNFKKSSKAPDEALDRPTEATKKKPVFYATNIIIKEESQPPYYNDDYNKNYHDEDYTDNYSDESSSQPEPCLLNSPYRYFESPKSNPNNPNVEEKYTLCSSYFQPNFGNSIYTVKMPITLLPSRFPPRVEQLIERIQNYFSTYTQQETSKPENHTLTTTTIQPSIHENEEQVSTATGNPNKKNTTEENQQLISEQTNSFEKVTLAGENEQSTPKTIVVTIPEKEEAAFTAAPDIQNEKESLVINQGIQTPVELLETTTMEAISAPQEEVPVGQEQPQVNLEAQKPVEVNLLSIESPENQSLAEGEIKLLDVTGFNSTTESPEMNNRTEEIFTLKDELLKLNDTDSYG